MQKSVYQLLLVAALLVTFSSCKNSENTKETVKKEVDFELIEASEQAFTAGQKDGASGVNFSAQIVVVKSGFKSAAICYNGMALETKESVNGKFLPTDQMANQGDTLWIRASFLREMNYGPCNPDPGGAKATLYYKLNDTEKKFPLNNIIVKKAKPRP